MEIASSGPLDAEIRVPPSKSLTQRALICAALAPGPSRLQHPLEADDTFLLSRALMVLGASLGRGPGEWLVEGLRELYPTRGGILRLGNAGTAMRFLIPVVALGRGAWTLDGSQRMRERPVGDLLEALRAHGVDARSYRDDGCPPVEIAADGLPGGEISIRGATSSQFISGLLLAGPRAREDLTIRIEGPLVSRPYVDLTVEVMSRFGAKVERDAASVLRVAATGYSPAVYEVEGDASSACWWLAAAAVTRGRVRVRGIPGSSLQGDLAFLGLMEEMGCRVRRETDESGDFIDLEGGALRGIDANLAHMPDAAPALGAVALFASSPTRIHGASHLRAKESDRISGLASCLGALGALVEEHRDGLTIRPGTLRGAVLDPLGDHRLAMAGAVAGMGIGGVHILDPGCVSKSYPGFFDELGRVTRPRT